jgi:hypothetical protein
MTNTVTKSFETSHECKVTICENKMPTRSSNRCFLLQILLLAQHVSGTIMSIIRSKQDKQPSAPHHADDLKTKQQIPQEATNCIILSSS